jgi:Putative adhesin
MAPTSWLRAAALAAGIFAAGCHAGGASPAGRASDEWVRSYEVPAGGEIQVSATNGAIELEGHDGAGVEVRAERIARAASDDAARELVSRIEIKDEVLPTRVSISTQGISGILIGVSYEVKYQVRAPHSVVARLRVTNGVIKAKAFAGQLIATSTNGGIVGEGLSGKLEARSTNGNVQIALQAISPGGVSLRTTNGRVDLSLPPAAKADLSAECRNGAVTVEGLTIEAFGEQSRRAVNGRLNGGGPPVDVETTNGAIRIRPLATEP